VFIDRDEITIVYGADVEKWCRRYGLDAFECPCHDCGAIRRTVLPFIFETVAGLIAEFCPCGSTNRPYVIVGVGGDLINTPGFLADLGARAKARRKRLAAERKKRERAQKRAEKRATR
jgi:hypothetical protein